MVCFFLPSALIPGLPDQPLSNNAGVSFDSSTQVASTPSWTSVPSHSRSIPPQVLPILAVLAITVFIIIVVVLAIRRFKVSRFFLLASYLRLNLPCRVHHVKQRWAKCQYRQATAPEFTDVNAHFTTKRERLGSIFKHQCKIAAYS